MAHGDPMSQRPTIYAAKRDVRRAVIGVLVAFLVAVWRCRAPLRADDEATDALSPSPYRPGRPSGSSNHLEMRRGDAALPRRRTDRSADGGYMAWPTDAAGQRVKTRRLMPCRSTGEWLWQRRCRATWSPATTIKLWLGPPPAPAWARQAPPLEPGARRSCLRGVRRRPPRSGRAVAAAKNSQLPPADGDVAFAVVEANGEDAGGLPRPMAPAGGPGHAGSVAAP